MPTSPTRTYAAATGAQALALVVLGSVALGGRPLCGLASLLLNRLVELCAGLVPSWGPGL